MTTTRNDTTTPHFFRSKSIRTVVIGGKLSLLHGIVMTSTNIHSFLLIFLALGVVLLVLDDLEEDENKELASQQRRPARPVGNKTASAVKPSVSALGKRKADKFDSKAAFYNNLGLAVKEGMEMLAMRDVPTPDRMKMKKLKAAIKIQELEIELKELKKMNSSSDGVPNWIAMSSSVSTPSFSVRYKKEDDDEAASTTISKEKI
jgi:hypothetical protein